MNDKSSANLPAVTPIIICGGSGSRLWPASRRDLAKPFVRLPGFKESLLAATYARLHHTAMPLAAVVTVAAASNVFLCRQTAAAHAPPVPHLFIGEPQGRNTAAAIIAAATMAARRFGDETILLALPADHLVGNVAAFWRAAAHAATLAQQGRFALLGITPDYPATGYGYIECGEKESGKEESDKKESDFGGGFSVTRFVEKPDSARAKQFLAAGNFLWNAGVFCMTAKTLFAELPKIAPQLQQCLPPLKQHLTDCGGAINPNNDIAAAADKADDNNQTAAETASTAADNNAPSNDNVWLPPSDVYAAFPNISFDYAVMEKTANTAVVAATDAQWSDVGTWRAVAQALPATQDGNVCVADAVLLNCRNCFVAGDKRLIAAVDVADLHIIDTPDALLVSSAAAAEKVRELFARLQQESRPEATTPATVHRPWGTYTVLSAAADYKVKRIEVSPGAMLSLQSHRHRSEHWTTVCGVMTIVIDEREFDMAVDESCHIPQGAKHRMRNNTDTVAAIIEVQIGDYLEENDIVRYEDIYGRR